jgi:diguanylate cyclase (GGDEF)-like protein
MTIPPAANLPIGRLSLTMAAANRADIRLRTIARGLLSKSPDAYAADSIELARRISGTVSVLTMVFTVVFAFFDPPTAALGNIGWAVVGATVVGGLVGAWRLFDFRQTVVWREIYALSFVGVFSVTGLTWLAGGGATPYTALFGMVVTGWALNPPRRSLPVLALAIGAAIAPLLYGPVDDNDVVLTLSTTMVWATIAFLAMLAADGLRTHQLQLVKDGELARVDPLTELGNRRAFDESLAVEVARVRRMGAPLSIALIDLDGLKQINDRLGHLEGDAALRKVAIGLTLAVRGADRVYRWAGDEFAIVFPDTTAGEAALVSERARGQIAAAANTSLGEPLMISYGVAQLMEGDPVELIDVADAALLAYKSARPPLRN